MKSSASTWLFAATFLLHAALLGSSAPAEVTLTGPLAAKLTATPPPLAVGGASAQEIRAKIKSGEIQLLTPVTEIPPGVEAQLDVEFGKGGTKPLLLDLFKPKEIKKPVPGLIFVHGGSWKEGSRKNYGIYSRDFARKGYVVATIEYRLSGEAPFPAALQDVRCAIRWMRANAGKLGVDPNKIALVGGSAGGHLVMLAAYSPHNDPELEGTGGNNGVSSRVQAVVDIYGVIGIGGRGIGRTTMINVRNPDPVLQFMGGKTWDTDRELYEKASPIKQVTKDAPPTLILHGTVDEVVKIGQSDRLAATLSDLGVPYLYDQVKGWHHGMDSVKAVHDHCEWMMDQFFTQVLPMPAQ
jgi:acetyl esterase/lipase